MPQLLETYSFTNDDIDLITYALRRLSHSAILGKDVQDLIEYIEQQKKEKTATVKK